MASNKNRKEKVIEALNKARSMELFAVHQYMNQHFKSSIRPSVNLERAKSVCLNVP